MLRLACSIAARPALGRQKSGSRLSGYHRAFWRTCVAGNAAGWLCGLSIEWNGEPVRRINKAFRSVRQAAGLGPDVVPHTLRHTAITWQAQLGVPIHEICGFFGITPEMFDRVYGHHHLDYQANAVNALSRRPTVSRQISRNQT